MGGKSPGKREREPRSSPSPLLSPPPHPPSFPLLPLPLLTLGTRWARAATVRRGCPAMSRSRCTSTARSSMSPPSPRATQAELRLSESSTRGTPPSSSRCITRQRVRSRHTGSSLGFGRGGETDGGRSRGKGEGRGAGPRDVRKGNLAAVGSLRYIPCLRANEEATSSPFVVAFTRRATRRRVRYW